MALIVLLISLTAVEKPPVLARTSVTLAAPIPPSND